MSKKSKNYDVTVDNIFEDLGLDKPDELMARAKLLFEVGTLIKASGLTQHEVSKRLGISQSKVSLLISGRLSEFSTDTLLHYLSILGCNVQIHLQKPRSRVGIFKNKGYIAVC